MFAKRKFWADYASKDFPCVASVALKLLSMHATTCSVERNWSIWGQVFVKLRNRLDISRAEKIIYIRMNTADRDLADHVDLIIKVFEEERGEASTSN